MSKWRWYTVPPLLCLSHYLCTCSFGVCVILKNQLPQFSSLLGQLHVRNIFRHELV